MGIIIIENSGACWQGTIFGDGIGLLSREYIWLHGASFKYNDSNSSMDDKTYFILAYAWKELIALFNIDSCKCNDSKSCTQSPISYINDKTHFTLAYGWKESIALLSHLNTMIQIPTFKLLHEWQNTLWFCI